MNSKCLVVDISKYQGNINFSDLAKTEIKGCIIRAGYRGYGKPGTIVTDPYFITNVNGCINNNIPYGVYFFSQATSVEEAKEEANYTLNLLKRFKIQPLFPIYIDTEYSNNLHTGRADKLAKDDRTNIVKAFCNTIENAGYYAGIYASTSWYNNKLNDSELINFTHWVADYRSYNGYKGNYGMWQYTSSGKLNGISGRCDLNWCYIDFPSVIKKAGLNGYNNNIKYFTFSIDKLTSGDVEKFKTLGDLLKVNYTVKEI